MKILLYIYIFKLIVLFLIFAFIMYEPKNIKIDTQGFDSSNFMLGSFAADYAAIGN